MRTLRPPPLALPPSNQSPLMEQKSKASPLRTLALILWLLTPVAMLPPYLILCLSTLGPPDGPDATSPLLCLPNINTTTPRRPYWLLILALASPFDTFLIFFTLLCIIDARRGFPPLRDQKVPFLLFSLHELVSRLQMRPLRLGERTVWPSLSCARMPKTSTNILSSLT